MQKTAPTPDSIFAELLKDLPAETEQLARDFKAFARARKSKTVAEWRRLVLLVAGLEQREREIAANVVLVNAAIKRLTDQAVRERLAACLAWLQARLPTLIKRTPLPELPAGVRLQVLDACAITAPGQSTVTWRMHLMMELVSLQLTAVHLTDFKTGERLLNFDFQSGAGVLAERGYRHRQGGAHLIEPGAPPVVRYSAQQFPSAEREGQPLKVAGALSACPPGETRTLAAQFTAPNGKTYARRIHA